MLDSGPVGVPGVPAATILSRGETDQDYSPNVDVHFCATAGGRQKAL